VTRSFALLALLFASACSADVDSSEKAPTQNGGSAGTGPDPSTVCGESQLGPSACAG
jgi:hypothetical protein